MVQPIQYLNEKGSPFVSLGLSSVAPGVLRSLVKIWIMPILTQSVTAALLHHVCNRIKVPCHPHVNSSVYSNTAQTCIAS